MSYIDFVRYQVATGKITMTVNAPEYMMQAQPLEEGEDVLLGKANLKTDYILDQQVVPRPPCPAILEGLDLSDLPVPCLITINGKPYSTERQALTLNFPNPGKYRLVISAFPYLDGSFEVTV